MLASLSTEVKAICFCSKTEQIWERKLNSILDDPSIYYRENLLIIVAAPANGCLTNEKGALM